MRAKNEYQTLLEERCIFINYNSIIIIILLYMYTVLSFFLSSCYPFSVECNVCK